MNTIYFRYREHPGDFLRNTDAIKLPNPKKEMEDFWVQFLPCYQSDDRVAFLNDLYKLLHDEFLDKEDEKKFVEYIGGNKTKQEINAEIQYIEQELIKDAYQNFYSLVLNNKIQLFDNEK